MHALKQPISPPYPAADPPRVLFAKTLTNSDCCQTISKGGRITLPRLAVETNLPALNNRKHNEVVSMRTCLPALVPGSSAC